MGVDPTDALDDAATAARVDPTTATAIRHRPFADGKFRGVWDSVRNSPYPWHYTLRWPWYFHHPSTRNHGRLAPRPDRAGTWPRDGHAAGEPIDAPHRDGDGAVRVVFAGDLMVLNGDRVPRLCPELAALVGSADLFVANLEAPLGSHAPDPARRYTFRFHMPEAVLRGIQAQLGLPFERWVLGNANNHSGDAGVAGFERSIELLDALGVQWLGHRDGGDRRSAQPLRRVVCNGLQLGFMAWTHWLNRDVFDARQPVLDARDAQALPADIRARAGFDYVIGLPHWEYEFQHFPRRGTRRRAAELLGAGFDLLVGSHPHVLQPYEVVDGKHCFYSLGNLCGLGIAWPVKIITLLEARLVRASAYAPVQLEAFRLHYFHQVDDGTTTAIVPLAQLPAPQWQRASARLARVVDHRLQAPAASADPLPAP